MKKSVPVSTCQQKGLLTRFNPLGNNAQTVKFTNETKKKVEFTVFEEAGEVNVNNNWNIGAKGGQDGYEGDVGHGRGGNERREIGKKTTKFYVAPNSNGSYSAVCPRRYYATAKIQNPQGVYEVLVWENKPFDWTTKNMSFLNKHLTAIN